METSHRTLIVAALLTMLTSPLFAGDFEQLGFDDKRSGASDEIADIAATLSARWATESVDLGSPATSTPVVSDGVVYVGCADGVLRAYATADGALLSTWTLSGRISATPTVRDGWIYVGTEGGFLYGIKALPSTAPAGQVGAWEWRVNHGGRQMSSPIVAEGLIIFSRGEPYKDLRAHRLDTQALAWSYDTQQISYSSPGYAQGYLFTASDNGRFFILDAADGSEVVPPFQTAGAVFTTSPVVRDNVDGTTNKFHIYAFPGDTDPNFYILQWTAGDPAITQIFKNAPNTVTGAYLSRKAALQQSGVTEPDLNDLINELKRDFSSGLIFDAQSPRDREAALSIWEQSHGAIEPTLRGRFMGWAEQQAATAGAGDGRQGSALSSAKVSGFSPNGLSRAASAAYFFNSAAGKNRWEGLITGVYLGYGPSPQLETSLMALEGNNATYWKRYGAHGPMEGIHVAAPTVYGNQNADDHLAVYGVGQEVHVYNLVTDSNIVIRPVTGYVRSSPVIANGTMFIATQVAGDPAGGRLYAFATQNDAPSRPTIAAGSPQNGVNLQVLAPTLSWNASTDAQEASSALSYELSMLLENVAFTVVLGAGVQSYAFPADLPADTKVTYKVRALDGKRAESPWSESAEFFVQMDTTPPQPVTTLNVIPGGDSLALSFTPSVSTDVEDVELSYEVAGQAMGPWASLGMVSSHTITGLTQNTSYTVRLRARDRRGNYSPNAEYLALTAPDDTDPPTVLSVTLMDPTSAGRITLAVVRFSEAVRDSTLANGAGFVLGGVAPSTATTGSFANDEVIELRWASGLSGTGGAQLTYQAAQGSVADLMNNKLADVSAASVQETDAAAPVLLSAFASENAIIFTGVDRDDTVTLSFSEPMADAVISQNNIDAVLALSGGHSWRSGGGAITSAAWNADRTVLTVTMSDTGGAPTVQVGDLITPAGGVLVDASADANAATNSVALTGLFALDEDAPTMVTMTTIDADRDGKVDAVQLVANEAMRDATLTPAGFTVSARAADGNVSGVADDAVMVITLSNPVSGTEPKAISYNASAGQWTDLSGNPLAAFSAVTAVDGAAPVVIAFAFFDDDANGFLDRLVFTFSEPLAATGLDIDDWVITDGDGHTNLLQGVTTADMSLSGALLTIRLTNSKGTILTPNWRFQSDGDSTTLGDGINQVESADNGSRPLAEAGVGIQVNPSVVTLDGSQSSDPDGDLLTATWTQLSGAVLAVQDAANLTPSLLVQRAGDYLFQLVVFDGKFYSTPDTVLVRVNNVAPTVSAVGGRFLKDIDDDLDVVIDARETSDANSTPQASDLLQFRFSQVGAPSPTAAPVVLIHESAQSAVARFDSSMAESGVYRFLVEVTDLGGLMAYQEVTVLIDGAQDSVPVADAGADQQVIAGATVVLNGKKSSDADVGDALNYIWRRLSGPDVLLDGAETSTPSFFAREAGVYEFELTVHDDKHLSLPDTVVVVVLPGDAAPPIAHAAATAGAMVGQAVTLSAVDSEIPQGSIAASYRWKQLSGTQVALDSDTAVEARFIPVQGGTYRFRLSVSSTTALGVILRDTVDVTVLVNDASNAVPVTVAQSPVKALINTAVTLDASASTDADGQTLSYRWAQLSGPAVTLNDSGIAKPVFTPTQVGLYAFSVQTNDGLVFGEAVQVLVQIDASAEEPVNHLPVAVIAPLTAVKQGQIVTLDGSSSHDPDDAAAVLTVRWRQLEGTPLVLQGANTLTPKAQPAIEGKYSFELIINDGVLDSAPALVSFSVIAEQSGSDAVDAVITPSPVATAAATPNTDGGPIGAPCFIVTATLSAAPFEGAMLVENAAGSYYLSEEDAYDLNVVRRFRDRYLMTGAFGRDLVERYYANGPMLAGAVQQSSAVRGMSFLLVVKPVIAMAKISTLTPLSWRDAWGVLALSGYVLLLGLGLRRLSRAAWRATVGSRR